MAEIIIMPKLGFDMDEGQLVKWYKSPGDTVSTGELFFEINTDKTAMPVESEIDGVVLKILLEEGDFAAVFTPIAVVGQPGENVDAALAAYSGGVGAADAANAEFIINNAELEGGSNMTGVDAEGGSDAPGNRKITPRARKYIKENNISPGVVAGIKGTGYEGGISEADVMAATVTPESRQEAALQLGTAQQSSATPMPGIGQDPKLQSAGFVVTVSNVDITSTGDKQILSTVPYKGVRKIIGDKLTLSMVQSPHIYFTDEVDTGPMAKFRADISEATGEKISVTDVLVMAASRALTKYPGVNSSLIDDHIVNYSSTNIGVAVAGDRGLIVPVIRNVQQKKISEVAKESRDLIERARTGSLRPDEYSGGTFTISNLGMFGIGNFTAIINPPEAAILAISAAKKKPVVVTDAGIEQIMIKSMMNIQLSVDHRLIDGLLAAQFVSYFKELIENPLAILLSGMLS